MFQNDVFRKQGVVATTSAGSEQQRVVSENACDRVFQKYMYWCRDPGKKNVTSSELISVYEGILK